MELKLSEMMALQDELQQMYMAKWGGLAPERTPMKLLWMLGEAGEVIDIVKKLNADQIMNTPDIRSRFVEEMADVLMYFNEALMCMGISAEEFSASYAAKMAHNLKRDYQSEHHDKFGV